MTDIGVHHSIFMANREGTDLGLLIDVVDCL